MSSSLRMVTSALPRHHQSRCEQAHVRAGWIADATSAARTVHRPSDARQLARGDGRTVRADRAHATERAGGGKRPNRGAVMAGQFNGKISLDIRDSTPDWDAFLDQKAPKDAPNVLVILYDDTGCAAWSTYGGRINMPTLDRLATQGLTYSQWHTTSVCSPT